MTSWRIAGGAVLGPAEPVPGEVAIHEGRLAPAAEAGSPCFDATGCWVLPGIVDIHGDAHERALQPRPGVDFPPAFALADAAAQILACGITTACLGVTLSWEPGLRSRETFRALLAAPWPAIPDLRLHLRFEADNLDALPDALAAIAAGRIGVLGFNDHTPGILRKARDPLALVKYAERAQVPVAEITRLAEAAMARRAEVPSARARLAEACRAAGVPMLSHDEATPEERAAFRALGATICEFPMAEAVAEAARAAGEHVVMGAPNVVRGGSHLGWASAAPLAERGLVTILASDYHWPALFAAPFVLMRRGRLRPAEAWALVSAHPAEALGLSDRGRLAPGLRADLLVVEGAPEAARPVAVFAGGELAWIAPGAGARITRRQAAACA
ncbi:MAG: alpha-D-ribose 1-methylphosphonate 5-triphosphate diphosphatase [Rhodovarius sp.]|nr:alpha-D-ribose 1-methylphosphonate 5-triphosphate diphosphatase [Rhodovarius sp.]MDW8314083.1 alpha-D-ribose 1-methylphosphonate 5-triphosphate diphosphatase [Rhodovarius sp.]